MAISLLILGLEKFSKLLNVNMKLLETTLTFSKNFRKF